MRSSRAFAGCLLLALVAWPGVVRAEKVESAEQVARDLAWTCNDKRFSDAALFLHESLRRVWRDIGYKVSEFCASISDDYQLSKVEIKRSYLVENYAAVHLVFVYKDGTRRQDRQAFLMEKGNWKLAG